MSLVCQDLHFAYNEAAVLWAVHLQVARGEFRVLLGRNGSGKTTLLYCLAGLLKPCQGRVAIDGMDLATAPRVEIARRIGLVPQEHADIFPFRVLDVVVMGRTPMLRFGRRPGPEDYRSARRVLVELEAGALAERNFNRISGGERRIALLARAIFQAQDTLLLDEPTNHLDFNNQYRLLEKIRRLCKEKGIRVVASMHDPNLTARFADTVTMLSEGRVLAHGAIDAVMTTAMISRLYQTPARRVILDDGRLLFVPCPTETHSAASVDETLSNRRWT